MRQVFRIVPSTGGGGPEFRVAAGNLPAQAGVHLVVRGPSVGCDVGGEPPRVDVGELYTSQRDRLIRLAYVLTGSQMTAEDIVQDTFIRVGPRLDDLGEQ